MDPATRNPFRTLWIGVVLLALILVLSLVISRRHGVASTVLPVLGTVQDFTLTNQLSQPVTLADLRGKVWLADIIFTRCPGPCPRMTRQMAEVQKTILGNAPVRLISLTTDPGYDSPEVLNKYAGRFQADPQRWQFLTGTKSEIAALAINSLKLTAIEKSATDRTSDDDLFIHSTIFVLVDKQGQLRGIFETSDEDHEWAQVRPAVLAAIKQLEREP